MNLEDRHIATKRKADHLDLTFKSQTASGINDARFMYEPLLGNINEIDLKTEFLNTEFDAPLWISSMTGGTGLATKINKNLARVCSEFGLGMGLGSCRQLLDSDDYFEDFNIRKYIGDRPLFANLGIAQIEQLVLAGKTYKVVDLVKKLQADGLIIHINPLQEFTQEEGDKLNQKPIDSLKELLEKEDLKIIVKEVGQGMGYNSLKELMQLPLTAIDFGAFGGTNFSKLEMFRNSNVSNNQYNSFINIGHTAEEMLGFVNKIKDELPDKILCNQIIISGGIKSFLDGYYYTEKINVPSIYGMASEFLKQATGEFELLREFVSKHIEGLKMAKAFLRIKN